MATRYEQAVEGLDIAVAGRVVRVRDGNDTWLVSREIWAHAKETMSAQSAYAMADDSEDLGGMEAYTDLCSLTARYAREGEGAVLSVAGSSYGTPAHRSDLAGMADVVDLLPESLATMSGVSVAG